MMDPRAAGGVGFKALTANPMRTALSTLGVVIGVGALVAVLALGDGVERFSRQQIAETTDLLAVALTPRTTRRVDDVVVPADPLLLADSDVTSLRAALPRNVTVGRGARAGIVLEGRSGRHGVIVEARTPMVPPLSRGTIRLNTAAATGLGYAIGDTVVLGEGSLAVAGIDTAEGTAKVLINWSDFAAAGLAREHPAVVAAVAARIEDVPAVQQRIEAWLGQRFGPSWSERMAVASHTMRVDQVRRAMLVFKLLMGAITGITLLVGGIGIMNVLLASVTERTREIGVRRAAGARRRDVMLQFLTESVAVTLAGGVVGIGLGYLVASITAGIMRRLTSAPMGIAFVWSTPTIALGAAIIVGVLFGLYPARRAARLSPIEAIRLE